MTEISVEESVPCTTEYFIEPGDRADWHIDQQWKCRKGRPRAGTSIIASVRRLLADSNGFRTSVTVPEDSEVPSRSYFLELRSVSGQFEGFL